MPVLTASGMLASPPMMKQAMHVLAAVAVIKFFLVSSYKAGGDQSRLAIHSSRLRHQLLSKSGHGSGETSFDSSLGWKLDDRKGRAC